MAYEVSLVPRARRELERAPRDVFLQLDTAIQLLQESPRPMGVQKLEGPLHRIRVRDWRIIYGIHDPERRVVILRITRRSEKTYRNLS